MDALKTLDFSWKHLAAVLLGGMVAFYLVRRNFLGIAAVVYGPRGCGDQLLYKF